MNNQVVNVCLCVCMWPKERARVKEQRLLELLQLLIHGD